MGLTKVSPKMIEESETYNSEQDNPYFFPTEMISPSKEEKSLEEIFKVENKSYIENKIR